ncbi:hypothetical protein CGCA056_v009211 [Colletotrichum aenigma]|uniref:uncharacterized protein n=1 Tax=Colletotrichum aenigma TaxID=1215731 RepID=UPI0018732907|nr:uncharacterized protein CGCA056_v009211 [Colletotrichum aenigma]KAF5519567.1 hypothetical protein CGCA056_v009211 [Colletotrichum aenigma]
MTPTKAAEEVTRSLVERVSSGISALPRLAEPQMQRRADQVRNHLAIPNYRAENAMQQRASDIRENMELPRLKRSYGQMSHSSPEPVSPGPAFPSDPLDLNLDGASMASYMSQMEYSPNVSHFSPSGRPTQNPMVAALSSGNMPRMQLHTDRNNRASLVPSSSPPGYRQSSSTPSTPRRPSSLRKVSFPTSDDTSNTMSSNRSSNTITPSPSRYAPGAMMSSSPIRETKLANPFKPTKESDAQLQMMMLHPQPISEHQSMVSRQVEKARELAKDKHKGPFQVGRHFCLIDPYNGEPVQIAVMKADGMGNVIYKDKFGRDVSKISPSGIGEPMPGKRGEFLGFKEDFGASHLFGPG